MDTESHMKLADAGLAAKVNTLAINAFRALGANDYGRIDIRLDDSGTPHFLEANLLPSLRDNYGNYFPRACVIYRNLAYEPMILQIADLAFSRDNAATVAFDKVDPLRNLAPLLVSPGPMFRAATL